MYKILLFFKNEMGNLVLSEVKDSFISAIRDLKGISYSLYDIESSMLTENKYSFLIEIIFTGKEEMERIFSTPAGKVLQKILAGIQNSTDIIFVKQESE